MDTPALAPAFVQQVLVALAGIQIEGAEAAALIPQIETFRRTLDVLQRFEADEVRSAALFTSDLYHSK
jgi:hypothetical protein